MESVLLQPLTPTDSDLLSDLLALNSDLQALALKRGLSLPDLIAWAAADPIASYIAAFHRFASLSDARREAARQTAVLTNLDHLLADSADPIERRRTAHTILRGSSSLPTRTRAHAAPQRTHHPAAPELCPQPHQAPPRQPALTAPAPPQSSPRAQPPTSHAPTLTDLLAALQPALDSLTPADLPVHPAPAHKRRNIQSLLAAAGASG
jgi:hypothetical protein